MATKLTNEHIEYINKTISQIKKYLEDEHKKVVDDIIAAHDDDEMEKESRLVDRQWDLENKSNFLDKYSEQIIQTYKTYKEKSKKTDLDPHIHFESYFWDLTKYLWESTSHESLRPTITYSKNPDWKKIGKWTEEYISNKENIITKDEERENIYKAITELKKEFTEEKNNNKETYIDIKIKVFEYIKSYYDEGYDDSPLYSLGSIEYKIEKENKEKESGYTNAELQILVLPLIQKIYEKLYPDPNRLAIRETLDILNKEWHEALDIYEGEAIYMPKFCIIDDAIKIIEKKQVDIINEYKKITTTNGYDPEKNNIYHFLKEFITKDPDFSYLDREENNMILKIYPGSEHYEKEISLEEFIEGYINHFIKGIEMEGYDYSYYDIFKYEQYLNTKEKSKNILENLDKYLPETKKQYKTHLKEKERQLNERSYLVNYMKELLLQRIKTADIKDENNPAALQHILEELKYTDNKKETIDTLKDAIEIVVEFNKKPQGFIKKHKYELSGWGLYTYANIHNPHPSLYLYKYDKREATYSISDDEERFQGTVEDISEIMDTEYKTEYKSFEKIRRAEEELDKIKVKNVELKEVAGKQKITYTDTEGKSQSFALTKAQKNTFKNSTTNEEKKYHIKRWAKTHYKNISLSQSQSKSLKK